MYNLRTYDKASVPLNTTSTFRNEISLHVQILFYLKSAPLRKIFLPIFVSISLVHLYRPSYSSPQQPNFTACIRIVAQLLRTNSLGLVQCIIYIG